MLYRIVIHRAGKGARVLVRDVAMPNPIQAGDYVRPGRDARIFRIAFVEHLVADVVTRVVAEGLHDEVVARDLVESHGFREEDE